MANSNNSNSNNGFNSYEQEEGVFFNPFLSVEEGGFLIYEEPCVEEVEEVEKGFTLPKKVIVNLLVRGVVALTGATISFFGGLSSYSGARSALWEKVVDARFSQEQLELNRCLKAAPDEPRFCARQKREVNKLRKEVLDLQQAFVWEGVLNPEDLEYHEEDVIFRILDYKGNELDPYE